MVVVQVEATKDTNITLGGGIAYALWRSVYAVKQVDVRNRVRIECWRRSARGFWSAWCVWGVSAGALTRCLIFGLLRLGSCAVRLLQEPLFREGHIAVLGIRYSKWVVQVAGAARATKKQGRVVDGNGRGGRRLMREI